MREQHATFSELVGKTIIEVKGLEKGSEKITFITRGRPGVFEVYHYEMYHRLDCCEVVYVEDVTGDIKDIIGSEVIQAEVIQADESESNEMPGDMLDKGDESSFTWTFYKLATAKGYLTIRWYGTSNGYYSESVDFFRAQ